MLDWLGPAFDAVDRFDHILILLSFLAKARVLGALRLLPPGRLFAAAAAGLDLLAAVSVWMLGSWLPGGTQSWIG